MLNKISRIPVDPIGAYPEDTIEINLNRIKAVRLKMRERKIDSLVIFSDREHCSNQEFLVGVGPRFEESLLILDQTDKIFFIHGNECAYLAPNPELNVKPILFQDFSPIGQPRDKSNGLGEILLQAGLSAGQKIGCVGWKSYSKSLHPNLENILDIPAYLADQLRLITGNHSDVINATEIFSDSSSGLRIILSALEIAQFEYAARIVSNSVQNLIENFSVGKSERFHEQFLVGNGLTLSCHKMISFGDKVRRGLSSPSDKSSKLGDPVTVAFGVSGALTARAGMVAHSASDLDQSTRNFYQDFSQNYWDAVSTWYSSLRLGASGKHIYESVTKVINPGLFHLMLNPGHNLHIEEWSQSIFSPNDNSEIRSGMVLQSDLIPISAGPFCYSNAEDGVAVADTTLRREIEFKFPDMWTRINKRKDFLKNQIGIKLDESILPLSDTCALYAPYILAFDKCYTKS